MKKAIGILFIIMSFFSIIFLVDFNTELIKIIKDVTFIIFLLTIEVIFSLMKKRKNLISLLEICIIIMAVCLKITAIIYLLPIIIFRIFHKVNMLYSMCISIGILYLFKDIDYFNLIIYTIIVNLYLYEVKKGDIDKKILKEKNRSNREENYRMLEDINNLEQYLEQNALIASLKERNFMAQKLHDHLGHRITSSLMQLEVTKETIDSDKEMSKKYLNTAMENLRTGMDEIRKMLKGVKPREKVLGIEDIKEHILKFQYSSRIRTNLKTEGDLERINLKLWLIIEENLKEALTNIAKYSEANLVTISILVYNKILRVEVRDNGKGSEFKRVGLGLKGIRERVEGENGRLEYFNDNGFVINMVFKI